MQEPLFEIESWRGGWFYKFGSLYTGPYDRRGDALAAARREVAILRTHWRRPLRPTLARAP